MARSLQQLTEQQIQAAIARGQLSGLSGEGKPLPDHAARSLGDMATEVAMRIMAEAGALPEEFRIRKALDAARAAYGKAATPEEKRLAMALIADLDLRYNTAVEARRAFMKP